MPSVSVTLSRLPLHPGKLRRGKHLSSPVAAQPKGLPKGEFPKVVSHSSTERLCRYGSISRVARGCYRASAVAATSRLLKSSRYLILALRFLFLGPQGFAKCRRRRRSARLSVEEFDHRLHVGVAHAWYREIR